jgi:hypothetical protein
MLNPSIRGWKPPCYGLGNDINNQLSRVSVSESQCGHSPVELIRSNSEKSSQIASFGTSNKLDIRF